MDFITLTAEDRVTETTKVTTGYFTGDLGTLAGSNFTTSSLTAGEKKYYYNLQYSSEDQLSVSYGHIHGSGSESGSTANKVGQTEAVYRQFASQLLKPEDVNGGFIINNTSQSSVHFIVAERARMKDRLNKKNWTLHLSGSNSASVPNSLFLTDDSEYSASTATPVGPRYNVISGSSGTGTVGTTYGHFYPNMGTIVLSTTQLSASIPGMPSTIVSTSLAGLVKDNGFAQDDAAAADNALKMVRALQLGSTTAFRSEEDQTSVMYFCRARAANFNYTNNPTFTSGSDNGFRQRTMEGNPQTFITTVGLYDAQDTLVAVGKLSTPVQKNYSSEAVIKAKLTY
tara:strand:+ start:1203 stop:2225 length:1023 start_codon:yes stop_codon:yes gene_type:complete